MAKKHIDEFSAAELKAYLETYLNVQVKAGTNKNSMKAEIQMSDPGVHEFEVPVLPENTAKKETSFVQPARLSADDSPVSGDLVCMREIIIPNESKPGGTNAVAIGVDGSVMFVERAKPQVIPNKYYHVLFNAVEKTYEPMPMNPSVGDMGGFGNPIFVPVYPYQLIRTIFLKDGKSVAPPENARDYDPRPHTT